MKSLGLSNRRVGSVAAVVALLLSTVAPGLLPAFASADQVTERSITLSSSSKSATNVSYDVQFTPSATGAGEGFVLDFCSNTPLIGESCTTPTDFSASSAATSTAGWSLSVKDSNTLLMTGTIANSTPVDVVITGIANPSVIGPVYARIVTYDTSAHMTSNYTDAATLGSGTVDQGSVAMDITDSIGVNAAVLESLTFCVSGEKADDHTNPITAGCGGTLVAPTLTLGETVGTVKALSSSAISTGDVYTQLSTNAASGAIVRIKSANACGGLKRFEATGCDIAPGGTGGWTFGAAKVGVKAAADSAKDTALSATGSFEIAPSSGYNGTDYNLNFNGTTSGVASAYGDPILDTDSSGTPTQPSNKNMKLTFGASVANNTPAGSYSNSYSLIATGKF